MFGLFLHNFKILIIVVFGEFLYRMGTFFLQGRKLFCKAPFELFFSETFFFTVFHQLQLTSNNIQSTVKM
jgi:hypothetical protein